MRYDLGNEETFDEVDLGGEGFWGFWLSHDDCYFQTS